MGEDYKCSQTENCAQSENGECIKCSKDYYLGNDKKCTNIEHCIYSGSYYYHLCDECEENYYYDSLNMTWKRKLKILLIVNFHQMEQNAQFVEIIII